MRILLFILIGLLTPATAGATSLSEYFGCDSNFFLGCGFVGDGPVTVGQQLAQMVINNVVGFAGLVAFIWICLGAFDLIFGQGEPEKGKKAIMYAVIGFVMVRLAYTFITFVSTFFQGV